MVEDLLYFWVHAMNSLTLLQSSRVPSGTKGDLDPEAREGVAEKDCIAQPSSIPNSIALNAEKIVPLDALESNANGRDATEDEINTLRHVTDRIPLAAWIVILAGAAERATYFGVIAPWRTLTPTPL